MITLAHAAAISKAKIETLRPEFQERIRQWFEACAQEGLIPYIYEGFRSNARQDELYAKGRTAPGRKVTNARAGQSFHNYGLAIDWVPLVRAVKPEGMYDASWDAEDLYARGNLLGEKYGLRQLSWETPHLEDAHFKDWRDLIV